jgi:hypothetical protein
MHWFNARYVGKMTTWKSRLIAHLVALTSKDSIRPSACSAGNPTPKKSVKSVVHLFPGFHLRYPSAVRKSTCSAVRVISDALSDSSRSATFLDPTIGKTGNDWPNK